MIYIILIFAFFALAIFNPIYIKPISSFLTEYLIFLSFIFYVIYFTKSRYELIIPNNILFLLVFLNTCFLLNIVNINFINFSYLFSFFLILNVTFSLQKKTENAYLIFVTLLLLCGIQSILFALFQWVGVAGNLNFILVSHGRIFSNFAQPNHLATFLFLSLISLYYLYEKNKVNLYVAFLISIFLLWGIVLTQSRTAWLVIFFILFFILFKSNKIDLKVSKIQLAGIFSIFWLMVISLPYVNQWLAPYFNIAQSSTLIERATTGHLRLNIWTQMIHAILEKPWFGYGWGQTTAAQYAVIDRYHGTEWASSAHNILLDILVWCGIPLGLLIIGYFVYLYFSFFFKSKSIETVCATLMISAVLIHAMLEYPLHYAYFLLPVGFLCGICLAEQKIKTFEISNKWGYIVVIIGFALLYQVFKEYDQITDNMVAANTHEMNEFKTELELPYDSIFFDKFEDRAKWIAQYPYMKVDQNILDLAERNINSYLTSYDLYKYAVLLAHNDQKEKAQRQLNILKIMYNEDVIYESLFIKKPSVNVPLETNSFTNK